VSGNPYSSTHPAISSAKTTWFPLGSTTENSRNPHGFASSPPPGGTTPAGSHRERRVGAQTEVNLDSVALDAGIVLRFDVPPESEIRFIERQRRLEVEGGQDGDSEEKRGVHRG